MISTEEQIRYWLSLTVVPKMGIKGLLKSALAAQVSLSKLHSISREKLSDIGWKDEQIACLTEAHPFTQKCIRWLNQGCLAEMPERAIISYCCQEYPDQLKQISQPPLLLFTDGDHRLLKMPQLAVVGSRGPTFSGLTNTRELVTELLHQSNLIITSGLALGVDAQSHNAALAMRPKSTTLSESPDSNKRESKSMQRGLGRTIGVLGNGIDVVYPKRHAAIYDQIRQFGLLVSEFPPSVMPSPKLFPRRNRIISGLSLGTLVTEARIKSGSLVTAKYALEQGREVFAMPSNINNKQAQGCHWLIKQGAKLTECAQDIFDEFPTLEINREQKQPTEKKPKQNLAKMSRLDSVCNNTERAQADKDNTDSSLVEASTILQAVDYEVTPIDEIAKRTGQPVSSLFVQLLEYELLGFVSSTSEGYLKLRD